MDYYIHQNNTTKFFAKKSFNYVEALSNFAVWTGLEPATSAVTGRHSNQLNYQTVALLRLQIYASISISQTF
jgi:hypothetical protein